MGNVCCGNDESKKASALDEAQTDHESLTSSGHVIGQPHIQNGNNNQNTNAYSAAAPVTLSPGQQKQENERQQALRQEQARLEIIVQAAGHSMVATSKGNLPYYNDQGFAAALAQHLEQTTSFPSRISMPLPEYPKQETVYARLSQGAVDTVPTVDERTLDQVAESFLDSALVTKERLFAGVKPIVENLI